MDKVVTCLKSSNGTIQVSYPSAALTIGLLVERAGLSVGTLLTPEQAEELAGVLLLGVAGLTSPPVCEALPDDSGDGLGLEK